MQITFFKYGNLIEMSSVGLDPFINGATLYKMLILSDDLNSSIKTKVEVSDCFSAYSNSLARYAGLIVTKIAPIFDVANWVKTQATLLVDHIATLSPFLTPRAKKALAILSTSALNCL